MSAPTGHSSMMLPLNGADVRAAVVRADEGVVAALEEDELVVLGDLLREAHAAVAEDAALAVDGHERRQLERLLEVALRLDEARAAGAPAEGDVLERALAALVADGAVERVVHEQELDDRVLRALHAVGGGDHDHAVLHRAWSTRSGASGCPRSRRGTCGRRRPARRAWARNRSRGSRRRRTWRRRRASSPRARAPRAPSISKVTNFCSGRAMARRAPLSATRGRARARRAARAPRGRGAARAVSMCSSNSARNFSIIDADRHRHRVAEHAQAVADDVAPGPGP